MKRVVILIRAPITAVITKRARAPREEVAICWAGAVTHVAHHAHRRAPRSLSAAQRADHADDPKSRSQIVFALGEGGPR
jgi:hypothetical protein